MGIPNLGANLKGVNQDVDIDVDTDIFVQINMSISSTAKVTIPQPHPHYGYSNHGPYQANTTLHGSSDSSLQSSSRLPSSYNTYPSLNTSSRRDSGTSITQPSAYNVPTSQSTSIISQPLKQERRPDWNDFYKNGPPKEIIVIDDDTPPPAQGKKMTTSKYPRSTANSNGNVEPANKKRKTGTTYDPVPRRDQASYSNTNTPHYASNTRSTDRTTSMHTTAPTSLGSHGSGSGGGTHIETTAVGQKRKRVTRQQTQEEKKRKEIEAIGDAYSYYHPPPNPPIKAPEVFVQSVKDVSAYYSDSSDEISC